ncbi:hypothetical protein HHK36_008941 [Tetracentron sinense]|uniref:E3 ubiquitin-protein ligase MARCHF6-like C-terminal domain-containing protein n=1 Tax=Tetracentron sinense TaxID=13715 RepID=A0A834Z9S2_TETSI|nr:hypothetical protein HHK36_008941 [Tetracentron sinense]
MRNSGCLQLPSSYDAYSGDDVYGCVGCAIFNAIPFLPITHGIKCNDMYAFIIGSCHLDSCSGSQIFVIPVLIGLIFELMVIVPMRVYVDESPSFPLVSGLGTGTHLSQDLD